MKLTLTWKAHVNKQCKWTMLMSYEMLTLSWKTCANMLCEWAKLISHAKKEEFAMWKEWMFNANRFSSWKEKFLPCKKSFFHVKEFFYMKSFYHASCKVILEIMIHNTQMSFHVKRWLIFSRKLCAWEEMSLINIGERPKEFPMWRGKAQGLP